MDSGIRYDEGSITTPERKKKMATITLNLGSKSDTQIGPDAAAVVEATNNKAKYAAVQAFITALNTATTAYTQALTDQLTKAALAESATQVKNDKRGDLEQALNDLATAMETTKPPFSEADLLEAKLTLRAAASAVGPLSAPIDFLATIGDDPGEMDLTWSAVKGRRYYDVEYRLNVDGSAWKRLDPSPTKSKATVSGLESGKEYIFRVRAVGTAGPSPWSDVSIGRAP